MKQLFKPAFSQVATRGMNPQAATNVAALGFLPKRQMQFVVWSQKMLPGAAVICGIYQK